MVNESALLTTEQKHEFGIITSTNEEEKTLEPVMESMRKQLTSSAKDILENSNNTDYQETIRKI